MCCWIRHKLCVAVRQYICLLITHRTMCMWGLISCLVNSQPGMNWMDPIKFLLCAVLCVFKIRSVWWSRICILQSCMTLVLSESSNCMEKPKSQGYYWSGVVAAASYYLQVCYSLCRRGKLDLYRRVKIGAQLRQLHWHHVKVLVNRDRKLRRLLIDLLSYPAIPVAVVVLPVLRLCWCCNPEAVFVL